MQIRSIILVVFGLILLSCNTDEDSKNNLKTKNRIAEENFYLAKMEAKENTPYNFSDNLKPEELAEFLPKSINGFETLPNSLGTQSTDDGKLFTFAKGQFSNSQRQSVIVDIFDYGKGNDIPNIKIYDEPPADLDSPVKKFQNEYSKGFWLIDKKLKYSRLEVLVGNRFVVIVRFNRPSDNNEEILNILKAVKLKELKELK